MKTSKYILMTTLAGVLTVSLMGCEQQGPMEEAGEKIDNSIERAGDKIENAGDKVEDKLDR